MTSTAQIDIKTSLSFGIVKGTQAKKRGLNRCFVWTGRSLLRRVRPVMVLSWSMDCFYLECLLICLFCLFTVRLFFFNPCIYFICWQTPTSCAANPQRIDKVLSLSFADHMPFHCRLTGYSSVWRVFCLLLVSVSECVMSLVTRDCNISLVYACIMSICLLICVGISSLLCEKPDGMHSRVRRTFCHCQHWIQLHRCLETLGIP